MTDISFTGWHAHIYFEPETRSQAEALCAAAADRFAIQVGRMHDGPVGPHPRASCQLSVPADAFGLVIPWLAANRRGLTVFAHGESGNHLADHTDHVIWLGDSEALDLSIFDKD